MIRQLISFSLLLSFFSLTSCSNNVNVDLLPVSDGDIFRYIDKEGKIKINPQFQEAGLFREGLAAAKTNGDNPKWGFINEKGEFVIQPIYKEVTSFSDGLAWVVMEKGSPVAIDQKGKTVFSLPKAKEVRVFSEGLAAFSVESDGDDKWGFVDKKGNIKINNQFEYCSVAGFKDGLCAVRKDGKWGYIDEKGGIKINAQFDGARDFKDGIAIVEIKNKYGSIDKKGDYILSTTYEDLAADGDLYLFKKDDKYGWCDAKGKIIINHQYNNAMPFMGNNLAPVEQTDGKWGYIDKEGKSSIPPQFGLALPFLNGLAFVASGKNSVSFIDEKGSYVTTAEIKGISRDYTNHVLGLGTAYNSVRTDKREEVKPDMGELPLPDGSFETEAPEAATVAPTTTDTAWGAPDF